MAQLMPQSGRRPQHHLRRFARTAATSAMPPNADIPLRRTNRRGGPMPQKNKSPGEVQGF